MPRLITFHGKLLVFSRSFFEKCIEIILLSCVPLGLHSLWKLNEFQNMHHLHTSVTPLMLMKHATLQTVFAVPLSCDNCIKSVSDAIHKLGGITKVEGNLKDQLISVEGSAAPSKIVAAIQDTGKDAILRGSGVSDSKSACTLLPGVCRFHEKGSQMLTTRV
jgi:copper chaperone CopZ